MYFCTNFVYMDFNFTPSEYQQKIFKFFSEGVGNVVINAKAGSSKTTTALKALDYIPSDKRVLFLAFNKTIANEINQKITGLYNVKAWTFHSLGYRILLEHFNTELDQFKYKTYIQKNAERLSEGAFESMQFDEKEKYRRNCEDLIDLARYNKAQSPAEVGAVAEKYGIVCYANEVEAVCEVMKWGRENTSTIDYTDMEWLPYELNLSTKKYKFDWIIVDEAQDTSPIRQELFKKCFKRGTRFAAVGDRDQTINTWCGSDASAFDNFLNEKDTIKLDLPICYRCPKKVIEKLQTLVPDIQAAPWAIEGDVRYDVSQYKAEPGDMVLCRNSAPLSILYSDYIKKNIKAYIKGSDIGKGLNALIKSTGAEDVSFDMTKDGIIPRLYKSLLKSLRKIMLTNGVDLDNAIQTDKFMKLYDSIKTIEILGNGTTDSEYLRARIQSIFTDERGEGICLTTVHKAKGLEADNVFILCPSLMPSMLAKKDWEIEAEHNIMYVAWSRAKKTLNFVSEKTFPLQRCFGDMSSVKTDVLQANEKMKLLYHKDYITDVLEATGQTINLANISKNKPEPVRHLKQKKVGANKFKSFLK